MRIDLTLGRAGQAGEHDEILQVESVFAGSGDDRLIGSPRSDEFDGGLGNDVLVGGPGDDRLDGGRKGRDRVRGGGGDDVLIGSAQEFDEPGDVLRCGPGSDTVGRPNGRDWLGGRCNWVDATGGGYFRASVRPVRRRPGGTLVYRLECLRPPRNARACRGKLRLHRGRGSFRRLSSLRRFGMPRGRARRATFDLSRPAVRRLRRPRALLQVRVRFGDRTCASCRTGWRTRVRPRR